MSFGPTTPILRIFDEHKAREFYDAVEPYQRALMGKAYKYYRPGLRDTEWGTREMVVHDPFGNRLVFSQPLPKS
jgi:Glyoxalase superfamily protein